jgi:hypothetical protein
MATIDFGSLSDLASDAVLQPDGKIVVVGDAQADDDVKIARLNARVGPGVQGAGSSSARICVRRGIARRR